MDDIKDEILKLIVQAAISRIVVAIPFLGIPVVGPLFSMLVSWVAGYLFDEAEKVLSFELIAIKTDHEKKEYDSAVNTLKDAIDRGNKDDIQKAKDEFKKKLSDLVSLKPN